MFLPVASNWLMPLSQIYGAVMRARNEFYRKGFFKTQRIGAPVISIGNITTGGTGKTPLVAHIARIIANEKHRPCILTRGYGRVDENARVVVRDGAKILADARTGGDEPRQLAETLDDTNAIIISDANRIEAARWALREFARENDAKAPNAKLIFILDDGFQHQRLARNLDVVTLDATNPFGDKRLLPCGRLREPLNALKRADAIVISRADQAKDQNELRDEVRQLTREGTPIFTTQLRTRALRSLDNFTVRIEDSNVFREEKVTDVLKTDTPVVAFCALGNPSSFFIHLQHDGHNLAHAHAFRDHHAYTQTDIDNLTREALKRGARALLTTAKDAVKLSSMKFALPCFAVDVELIIDDAEKFRDMIRTSFKQETF